MTANPQTFVIAPGVWSLVAPGVEIGLINILDPQVSYLITYRIAGSTDIPNASDLDDSPKVQTLSVDIKSVDPIDVYVYPIPQNPPRYGRISVST